jgi:hypothetical protein
MAQFLQQYLASINFDTGNRFETYIVATIHRGQSVVITASHQICDVGTFRSSRYHFVRTTASRIASPGRRPRSPACLQCYNLYATCKFQVQGLYTYKNFDSHGGDATAEIQASNAGLSGPSHQQLAGRSKTKTSRHPLLHTRSGSVS